MPRNVRNYWLELTVDGKKTKVATGPVSKTGGFVLDIKMRSCGGVAYKGRLHGTCEALTGRLSLFWEPAADEGVDPWDTIDLAESTR